MTQDARISFADAIGALRAEYYSDIRDIAQEIKKAIEDGEIEDRDSLQTRIHETCDGNQWVIYTQNAQVVLLVSSNDGAYADEYGAEGMTTDGAINWSVMAYAAMEQDLMEQLDSEGVDVNGDTPAEMLGKEEEADDE
jgi:hypothetical protein